MIGEGRSCGRTTDNPAARRLCGAPLAGHPVRGRILHSSEVDDLMKMRRSLLIPALAAAFSLAGLAQGQAPATDETPPTEEPSPVEVEYAPEDGAVYDITERTTRISTVGGADPVTDVRERVSELVIAMGEEGYTNRVTIASEALSRNGNAIPSPLFPALAGLELVYEVASDGSLTAITGHEGLSAAIASIFPDKLAGTLDALLNHDALRQQDAGRYAEVHGPYIGASVTLAENEASVASQMLPSGGSMPVYTLTTITQDEGTLTVTRVHSSDAEALAEGVEKVTADDLLALSGDLEADLPAAHASAAVGGMEETTVEASGALVTSRIVQMRYEHTPRQPPGTAPVTNTLDVTEVYSAVKRPAPDPMSEEAPEAQP